MTRLLHAILLGLVGAGIVHIAVLAMVPSYSQKDTWALLSERSNYYVPTRLDPPDGPPLVASLEPLFGALACRFDLREGVVRVSGEGDVPFWSISVYDRTGQNTFSFNDRSTEDARLDFVVGTPVQMVDLRNALPEAFADSIFVEADVDDGIVLVRAFRPDPTWTGIVESFLSSVRCEPNG
jgi:uncharacterized membrane protein